MTSTDALAAIGLMSIFLGLWLILPALAIIVVGAVLLLTAVGLVVLKRRERAAGDR